MFGTKTYLFLIWLCTQQFSTCNQTIVFKMHILSFYLRIF
uniref:Uncharacterized protein n=1 Tax=Anguilla anguilla TaxID=7936 RepID=A0A0E9VRI1_ANGAN